MDDSGLGDFGVGQSFGAAVVGVSEPRVVEAQLMQDRGVQVGGADAVLDGLRRHLRLRFG